MPDPPNPDSEEDIDNAATQGPLGFASLDGPFPAQPLLVEAYQEKWSFAVPVQRFQKNRGFYTQPLEHFRPTVD